MAIGMERRRVAIGSLKTNWGPFGIGTDTLLPKTSQTLSLTDKQQTERPEPIMNG
jgi:hypothetical protein